VKELSTAAPVADVPEVTPPAARGDARWPKLLSRQVVIILIGLAATFGTAWTGHNFRMDTTVYARNVSMPVAISWLYHGGSGYTAFQQVADALSEKGLGEKSLQEMVQLDNIDRSRLEYIPADDKGRVDFAVFSFALFGPHIYSLYLGFFGHERGMRRTRILERVVLLCYSWLREHHTKIPGAVASSA
jgi:hypothetical protein